MSRLTADMVLGMAPEIERIAGRMARCYPRLERDDVKSEAYAIACQLTKSFNPEHQVPFRAYLCSWLPKSLESWCKDERCRSKRRQRKRAVQYVSLESLTRGVRDAVPETLRTYPDVDRDPRVTLIIHALDQLTSRQRKIVIRSIVHEEQNTSIGRDHGISGEAIRQTREKALRLMRGSIYKIVQQAAACDGRAFVGKASSCLSQPNTDLKSSKT